MAIYAVVSTKYRCWRTVLALYAHELPKLQSGAAHLGELGDQAFDVPLGHHEGCVLVRGAGGPTDELRGGAVPERRGEAAVVEEPAEARGGDF